jgi:hypothetical protein
MKLQYLLIAMACVVTPLCIAEESPEVEGTINFDAPCYDTNLLFTELKTKYKETPIIMGIASDQVKSTMSLWINSVDETWTIISTKKDTSCIIGIGVDFKVVPIKKTRGT